MMSHRRFAVVVLLVLPLYALPAAAILELGTPFGEHMVLQQGVPIPIWGTGAPGGDTVRVSFHGQSVTAKSDWEGRWMVTLAPMKAGGPFQMVVEIGGYGPLISSSAANSREGLELNDVVVGEVRVMPPDFRAKQQDLRMATKKAPANGEGPSSWLRVVDSSRRDGEGWRVYSLDLASENSAAEYAFARELYKQLRVPIGVIENLGESGMAQ
jgi:sialate O-acetylesterase